MVVVIVVLGCSLGMLAAGAALVAGFSWITAVCVYFGAGLISLLTAIVLTLMRRKKEEPDQKAFR